MIPLHLCSPYLNFRKQSRLKIAIYRRKNFVSGLALFGTLGLLSAAPLWAQDKKGDPETKKSETKQTDPKQADSKADAAGQDKADKQDPPEKQDVPLAMPVVNFHTRPKVKTDPQRPRRTVAVNGILNEGEWDPFYMVTEGPVKGTVYCNWDDNYLYVAVRTDMAAMLVLDIDATNDGWLRSADNMEIVIGSITESGSSPTVVARLLDAANSKETPTWTTLSNDVKQIQVSGKLDASKQVVTIAIPKNIGSLVLRPGATIGLRCEFLPPGEASAYIPTAAFEPHLLLDATLVEARVIAAAGITPRLTISDNKCVPGQKLFATLELFNQTDSPMPIKSVLWTGAGNSANAVNTMRDVAVKPIGPMKRDKLTYKTLLPPDLPIGSYTLTVTAELDNGKQVQSSASFSVVEPLQPQIVTVPDPVTVVGPTTFAVSIDVYNATPGEMNCNLEITTVPAGWELENKRTKLPLTIEKQDGRGARQFVFKLPSTTPAGDYPIDATVTWHKRVWKLRTVAHVLRPEPVVPPQPKG